MNDPFDDINPEGLDPEQQAALEHLRSLSPEERQRFLGHLTLVNAAWRFLRPLAERDLRAAWPALDEDLRLALAQQWVLDNSAELDRDGYNRDEVAAAIAADEPEHPLWRHFERVHLRGFDQVLPPAETWGIGANTRLIAPDIEVLFLHDISDMPDTQWQPGEERHVYPILMRWDGEAWRVRNFGTEIEPVPGWPPVLG